MDIVILFAALALLIGGAWAGISVLLLAPGLAVAAALVSGAPGLAQWTQIFMPAAGGFVVAFLPLFLMGAVFGRVMETSGAAASLARAIAGALGRDRAILAVVLACAALTYGGVSLFVVAFAAWPLARALFAETGTPARLVPAAIALGAFTFTMTALPGTPAIQNAIPMPHFGTAAFAAPGLGVIAAGVMLGFGMAWLGWRRGRLAGADPPGAGPEDAAPPPAVAVWRAALPVLSVAVLTLVAGVVLPRIDTAYLAGPAYGATDLSRVAGLWAVLLALVGATVLALALAPPPAPLASLNRGAESALLPLFNTASLVGFGAVAAALPGFAAVRGALDALAGGDVVVQAALATGVLAGITGSASGGMSIALDAIGADLLAQARAQGVDPALLHRVVAVATGGLDTLPHNGAVITLLGICGMTHARAYGDIFMVAVAGPLLACGVIVALGAAFGAF